MILSYGFQEKLIFLNEKLPQDFQYSFVGDFEEVNLKTEDNNTINALHFKVENPKGIILYFHGNKGSLERWGNIVQPYTNYGYDVFVMDYRSYGKSTGAFNEAKMYDDAMLCYHHVKKQYSEDKIVLYGRSLGTTFATFVGSKNNPKHIILEAPFYNLHAAANYQFKVVPKFLFKYKLPTDKLIRNIKSPITFFHGTNDKVTSPEDSKRLMKLVPHQENELVIIESAVHGNIGDFQIYKDVLTSILER
ncbi:alpha/beta hydrolase [Lutibacter sp. Hel_I_33_5]|uniref:alpha/beta hydrolase n=1 Tax=Lutibacter sp. Hel_I_33_5 TaxID=1566289 RepID=UPI0016459E67|nr:alpha/beta fold hydrolase [Lutibacter sp. Hel_I_33_5]